MPSVNMIAAKRAEKKKLEEHVRIALITVLGLIAIAIGILSFMTARVYGTTHAIRNVDEELRKIQPTVEKIKDYEAQINELMPRLNLLTESRDQTLLWYRVLQNMSYSMPEQTWLTSMATKVTSTAGTDGKTDQITVVDLKGLSSSQRLVGEAMLRLNQAPDLDGVDLVYTQIGSATGLNVLDFNITAKLKNGNRKEGGALNNAGD